MEWIKEQISILNEYSESPQTRSKQALKNKVQQVEEATSTIPKQPKQKV